MSDLNTISISHEKFSKGASYSQTPQVLQEWTTHGCHQASSRYCQSCKTKLNPEPHPFKVFHHQLILKPPPPHIHIQLDIAYLYHSDPPEAFRMMRECNLPYKLTLNRTTYLIRACGFWNGDHYWCQVVHTLGNLAGVWAQDDQVNAGIVTLLYTDLEVIGGPLPNTSWVMYFQTPTAKEFEKDAEKVANPVNESDKKDKYLANRVNETSDNKDVDVPLVMKKKLTNSKLTKQGNKTMKRKTREEYKEVELALEVEPKIVEQKQVKRNKKAKGWKGWAIVDEQEIVKDEHLQEAQEEANEGEGNVQKPKRTKRKRE
ncbi:hypothetical protein DFH28DRAFT_1121141 [Melampsora americana]|nr:hypothetical protein DFH28DRAFT_1121141 [Melampsora americana]